MSQDIFQRKIDQTHENCKGAVGIADDVQVFGNEKTYDRNLHEAIECTRKQALSLILRNVLLRLNAVVFGNLYTPEEVKPDPKKVEAIKQI